MKKEKAKNIKKTVESSTGNIEEKLSVIILWGFVISMIILSLAFIMELPAIKSVLAKSPDNGITDNEFLESSVINLGSMVQAIKTPGKTDGSYFPLILSLAGIVFLILVPVAGIVYILCCYIRKRNKKLVFILIALLSILIASIIIGFFK
jgi:hypothetical protein